MTEYTKEEPFEFEGVKIWRTERGGAKVYVPIEGEYLVPARAVHAFIEAEREGWHWTNDERTEARNGRWSAQRSTDNKWLIYHDDFHSAVGGEGWSTKCISNPCFIGRKKVADFLAWHAAQSQPVEPTGLGAVVECENGDTWTRIGRGGFQWFRTSKNSSVGTVLWGNWRDVTKRGPVTILSQGVTR